MIQIYTQQAQAEYWLKCYQGKLPLFACVLGFTATGLLPGISAAGATPEARQYTAIADAEFLHHGCQTAPIYPLPPLEAGISPVLISRSVIEAFKLPLCIFNAGLKIAPTIPAIDLGGIPAQCLSSGVALPVAMVKNLFEQGCVWGDKLANGREQSYVILSECVVGGTTTALAILKGLGFEVDGMVSSSICEGNHAQKSQLVKQGLEKANYLPNEDPLNLVAAVGDPMQIVVAGMAIAASRRCGVMLAGGTQMLAVYALIQALSNYHKLVWEPNQVIVGTTRWVAQDTSADTVGLAEEIGSVPLIATKLSFALSRYPQLRIYERGFVKEGVGAGGCGITASLYQGWKSDQLVEAVEELVERCSSLVL